MRLIDADKIVFDYSGLVHIQHSGGMEIARYFANQIRNLPTIEAAPIVHGRWEEKDDDWFQTYYTCSNCNEDYVLEAGTPKENGYNYCPYCGAIMDGDNLTRLEL